MSYFSKFPSIYYDFNYGKNDTRLQVLRDITVNVRLQKDVLNNVVAYDIYDIKDGETPEILAHKWYGHAEYHWIIMIANEKYDYIADFPMDVVSLEKYIDDKYGVTKDDVHHYVDSNGYIVDVYSNGTPVSNYQYEFELNDKKRRVKMIRPEYINSIVTTLDKLIS